MSEWTGAYICHVCKKCECAFIAEDYTNAQDVPPHWRYCPKCAEKLGIDYDKQKPMDNFSEAQKNRIKKQIERLKIAGKKTQFKKKQNIEN